MSNEIVKKLNEAYGKDGVDGLLCCLGSYLHHNYGMTEVSKAMGVPREGLYKTLTPFKNPQLKRIKELLNVLGLDFTIVEKK